MEIITTHPTPDLSIPDRRQDGELSNFWRSAACPATKGSAEWVGCQRS